MRMMTGCAKEDVGSRKTTAVEVRVNSLKNGVGASSVDCMSGLYGVGGFPAATTEVG